MVNQSFVSRVLGGRNPVGRHFQYRYGRDYDGPRANQPWIEIVGVVRDIGVGREPDTAGIYLPLDLVSAGNVYLAARVSGDMAAATTVLRSIAARTDPLLRVSAVQPLDRVTADGIRFINFWIELLTIVSVSALVLALSGLYAVTSVHRRSAYARDRHTRGARVGPAARGGHDPPRTIDPHVDRHRPRLGAGNRSRRPRSPALRRTSPCCSPTSP